MEEQLSSYIEKLLFALCYPQISRHCRYCNLLLVERISTLTGKLRPGDVVIFRSLETPRKIVCKRLIGMEGDQVTYVVDPQFSDRCETIVVPKGHVWVEGDYIYNTKDSRNFGAVPYGLLKGRAFLDVLCAEELAGCRSNLKGPSSCSTRRSGCQVGGGGRNCFGHIKELCMQFVPQENIGFDFRGKCCEVG